MYDKILILDTETTGLGPTATCIEVACALYSIRHAAVIRSFSSLIRADDNPAEPINRIPPALLLDAPEPGPVWSHVETMAKAARAVVAHNAEFDRRFVPAAVILDTPWICSKDDLEFPRGRGESLVKMALAHDLGVSHAHRAAVDVDLLARLFTRAAEMGSDIEKMIERGLRPRGTFVAITSYAEREKAKAAGFGWDGKRWTRRMALEDAEALPFKVERIGNA